MIQFKTVSMEELRFQSQFFFAVIKRIADYRMSDELGMDAYLMGSARSQFEFNEHILSAEPFHDGIIRYRAAAVFIDGHLFTIRLVPRDRLIDNARIFFDVAVEKSEIIPAGRLFFDLRRKRQVRLVVFCDNDQPRRILIQTVDDAGAELSVDTTQIFDVI